MFPSHCRYGTGTLTKVFMDRVFQECLTYDGEMDYKTYLDFVLAMENRHEPQSLQYLFRILDINNKGYLDTFCLNYFFRVSNTSGNFTVSNAIHTYIYIHTYVHTYIPMYIHIYIHTYICTCMHTYIHTYICTCIHTYIHTYTHTYVRTYIHLVI